MLFDEDKLVCYYLLTVKAKTYNPQPHIKRFDWMEHNFLFQINTQDFFRHLYNIHITFKSGTRHKLAVR